MSHKASIDGLNLKQVVGHGSRELKFKIFRFSLWLKNFEDVDVCFWWSNDKNMRSLTLLSHRVCHMYSTVPCRPYWQKSILALESISYIQSFSNAPTHPKLWQSSSPENKEIQSKAPAMCDIYYKSHMLLFSFILVFFLSIWREWIEGWQQRGGDYLKDLLKSRQRKMKAWSGRDHRLQLQQRAVVMEVIK